MLRAALIAIAWLPFAAWAQPSTYRIDPERTRAEFEVEHLGFFYARGRFAHVTGALVYDASAQSGVVDVAIPIASVDTGWSTRDSFLRGTTMFDAARFPTMRFVSERLTFEAGRLVRAQGALTLRDVTRPVVLVVDALRCDVDTCVAEATANISRREFGMDNWAPLIGDDVALRLRLLAVRE